MVKAYWQIGKEIVEKEQHGQKRAEYGKAILKNLSLKLQNKYKRGFGIDTLEQARKFLFNISSKENPDIRRSASDI